MTVLPSDFVPPVALFAEVLADMPGCYTATKTTYETHVEYEVVLMPGCEPEDFFPLFSMIPVGCSTLDPVEAIVDESIGTILKYVHNIT
jgi:hypothetical protein